jgi:type IV/VI secretion system ImpK/VasF family protein
MATIMATATTMATTKPIWSQIVATFEAMDRVFTEALAAELSAQRGKAEQRLKSSFADGRSVTGGEAQADLPLELHRYPRAVDLAKDLSFREAHANGADLVRMREGLRKLLDTLRKDLARTLSEHEVYSILVPIVVYADELARVVTRGSVQTWEPLQSETFNIENGGELFYWAIDERLRHQDTHPLVFEVFYFCLNDGFVGMHQGDPRKIEEYKDRLRKRIPTRPTGSAPRKDKVAPKLIRFPWQYYGAAAALTLVIYAVLRWYAYSLA